MDQFKVELEKDDNGYGLSIIGMGIGADSGVERLGIYVKKVFPGQAAERVGIQMADQIVEVDGVSLVGVSHQFASDALRGTNQVRNRSSSPRQLVYKKHADGQVFFIPRVKI